MSEAITGLDTQTSDFWEKNPTFGLLPGSRWGIPKLSSSSEAPSGLQNFIEMCVEFVNENVQSIFTSAKNNLIGPMALTVLVWVFLMNLMDLM